MPITTGQEAIYKVLAKAQGELDIEWADLKEEINFPFSSDYLARMGAGIKWADDNNLIRREGNFEDVEEKVYKESVNYRDRQNFKRDEWRTKARSEEIRREISNAVASLGSLSTTVDYVQLPRNNTKKLMVTLADAHYGAEWRVLGLQGELLNEYSPEIFEARMALLALHIRDIAKKEGTDQIVICMLGDSLDGMLRASQLMKLRYGMIESCIRYAEFVANWVNDLSAEFSSVEVYNVDGNHTEVRPLGSKKGDFAEENLERIISWFMKERLSSNEKVYVDDEFTKRKLINVCGQNILLTHGDEDGELLAAARDYMLLYSTRIDMMLTAHKHEKKYGFSGETPDGNSEIIRSPSICGIDGFAQKLKLGGKAGSCVMVIEEGKGRVVEYPVRLN